MIRSNQSFRQFELAADVGPKLRSAIEFGAVVAIVMALSVLAVRNFESFAIRAQISEAFMLTTLVRVDLIVFYAQHGRWPGKENEVPNSTLSETSGVGNVVDRVELRDGGTVTVIFHEARTPANLQGKRLSFRPAMSTSSSATVSWICADRAVPGGFAVAGDDETDVDPRHLPSSCKQRR